MRRQLSAVLLLAVLLSTAFGASLAAVPAAGAATTSGYEIAGYVVETDATGNAPMSGVGVVITDAAKNTYSGSTDATGYFCITVGSLTGLTVEFVHSGYTVRSCPTAITQTANGLALSVTGITPTARTEEGATIYTYLITSGSASGLSCVVMSSTVGVVVVTVTNGTKVLADAQVTLTSATDSGLRYIGTSDGSGRLVFNDVKTGYYYMSATSTGFYDSMTSTVTVEDGYSYFSVDLQQKAVDTYFGMTLSHILMIVGVIFGLVMALVAWLLFRRGRVELDSSCDDGPK